MKEKIEVLIKGVNTAFDGDEENLTLSIIKETIEGIEFPCIGIDTMKRGNDTGAPIILLPNGNTISAGFIEIQYL
jgi:hypothetical protein